MPWYNGIGPQGYGPGTGRGMGPCGAGMRRGGRGGYGYRMHVAVVDDLTELRREEKLLRAELQDIEDRIASLENQS